MKLKKNKLLIILIIFIMAIYGNILSAEDEFFTPKTTIGGYGELHFNYKKKDVDAKGSKTLDFHRFVLFLSHSFSEKWSFKAELELEHNFVSEGQGELELEQAYINYHASDYFGFQAGVILPSIGMINEYHEPPLFLSVERPDYNKYIIPTTWFGNGVAIYGRFKSFNYKFVVMEGLNSDGFSLKNGIRGGRQKGFKANAEELLYNFKLDYTGITGLKTGISYSYNNALGNDSGETNAITIFEAHLRYNRNDFFLAFEIGNVNYEKGNPVKSNGYYLDIGYNIGNILKLDFELIPWFRWTDYNTAADTLEAGDMEKMYNTRKWLIGLVLKPNSNIVYKLEMGEQKNGLSLQRTNIINFGVGYMF